jgi:hypothetical protein
MITLTDLNNAINSENSHPSVDDTTASLSHNLSSPPDYSLSRNHTLNIGSLNCRGLTKTASPSTRNQFIRYLRTRSLDILALQETHASTSSIQDIFQIQFQASSSLWSGYNKSSFKSTVTKSVE